MTAHPVREAGGRACHVKAFEQIACGNWSLESKRVLTWLVAHGLIEWRGLCYAVPVHVHIAWCEWCYEQQAKQGQDVLKTLARGAAAPSST